MSSGQKMTTFVAVITVLGVVLALAPAANAALIAEDGFNYTAGTILTESGQGWQAGDVWSGGARAVAPGMTYTGLTNMGVNKYEGSGQHFRYIDTSVGSLAAAAGVLDGSNNIGADGSTVWMSFLGKKDTASWGGVSVYRGGSEQHFIGKNGGGTGTWGVILYGDGGGPYWSTKDVHTDSLVVVKWDFTATNDRTQMWVNPVIAAGEAGLGVADVDRTRTGFSFNRIRLGNGGGLLTVDELRLGTTWDDVTGNIGPPPPPPPPPPPAAFTVKAYNIVGGGGSNDNDINSASENLTIWDFLDANPGHTGNTGDVGTGKIYNVQNNHTDVAGVIDYAGGGGDFGVNNPYSTIGTGAGLGGDDFSVRALSTITFNTGGTYTIRAGSDDGRYLRLAGVTFDSVGGQGGTYQPLADTVVFDATTGHDRSWGTFTVAPGTVATLDSHFFERGSGDSFELSISNSGSGGPYVLLQDDPFGGGEISVSPTYTLPDRLRPVARLTGGGGPTGLDVQGGAYVDDNGTARAPTSWTLEERGAPVTVPGLFETIWDDALPDGDVTGNIENIRAAAAGPLGPNDAQGVLTGHLHYDNDAAVDSRAAALGAPGFDPGNFTMLWTTDFTPDLDGDWGFRNNNVDDRYSFWIDLDQDGTLESDERFFQRGSCCAGSGDRFISEASSSIDTLLDGQTYLLGFVMNDTGAGGYFRDMEFLRPGGSWTDLDPSATGNLFTVEYAPWNLVATGTSTVGDPLSDGLFGVTMTPGDHYLRLTTQTYATTDVAEGLFTFVYIPEPSTFLIWALGLLGLAWYGWRRKR